MVAAIGSSRWHAALKMEMSQHFPIWQRPQQQRLRERLIQFFYFLLFRYRFKSRKHLLPRELQPPHHGNHPKTVAPCWDRGPPTRQEQGKALQTKPRPPRGRRSEPAVRPGLHSVRNPSDRHGDIDFGRSAPAWIIRPDRINGAAIVTVGAKETELRRWSTAAAVKEKRV
ncbi:cysteine/Histidine-rich C1 domain family protein [Striga asiatica]|uniref:Cysteine/Histidine-rich C1 domain family protein n=1 Tax=Striga asiatica TaxID=4170 RepID=A0A5A7QCM8_STRAF|nr:cysteine/Histidine-rich C1 domain family protein [Striga asiatica]